MGSGEGDAVKIHDIKVMAGDEPTQPLGKVTLTGSTTTNSSTITIGNSTSGYWNNGTYQYYWPYYYPYTTIKYMYQVRCPRCRKMNWCGLDEITSCKKCYAQLRAVNKKVDYDIEIDS